MDVPRQALPSVASNQQLTTVITLFASQLLLCWQHSTMGSVH